MAWAGGGQRAARGTDLTRWGKSWVIMVICEELFPGLQGRQIRWPYVSPC